MIYVSCVDRKGADSFTDGAVVAGLSFCSMMSDKHIPSLSLQHTQTRKTYLRTPWIIGCLCKEGKVFAVLMPVASIPSLPLRGVPLMPFNTSSWHTCELRC